MIKHAPSETSLRDLLALCGVTPDAQQFLIAVRTPEGPVAVGAGGTNHDIQEMFYAIAETIKVIYSTEGETMQ